MDLLFREMMQRTMYKFNIFHLNKKFTINHITKRNTIYKVIISLIVSSQIYKISIINAYSVFVLLYRKITSNHQLNESDMRTQEIREMEKRAEMYRRLLIWNIVFLLGLLCWGSVLGQSGEYIPKKGIGLNQLYDFMTTKDGSIIGTTAIDNAFPLFDTVILIKINQHQQIVFKNTYSCVRKHSFYYKCFRDKRWRSYFWIQ
jgi:hypothetical protein